MDALFSLYDKDGNGVLDYKEFSSVLLNKEIGSSGSPAKGGSSTGPEDLVERLR